MENENKNLILAIVLCAAILMGYQFFFDKPQNPATPAQTTDTMHHQDTAPVSAQKKETPILKREDAIVQAARIPLLSETLKGSINTQGGRLDDILLLKYRETTDPESKHVPLLSPAGTQNPFFAEFGWVSADKALHLPTSTTNWTAIREQLTPDTPVVLSWTNDQGVVFERVVEMDDKYMFTVRDRVKNTTSNAITLQNYGLISRGGNPPVSDFFILYEGPIGYLGDKSREHKYDELMEEKRISYSSKGGWIGMTDKYWLAALIPDQNLNVDANFVGYVKNNKNQYQTDFTGPVQTVAPGETLEVTNHVFAGAKSVSLLDAYEKTLGVKHFDLAVDFGWFYFITKPIFYVLTFFHQLLGNFGLAILLLTVIMRLLFFPLASKQYSSMSKMRNLQPHLKKLKERYGDDKVRMQQEMMAFYKKNKVNPAAGCLPILIQIPVFFALYKVLFVTLEMRHAPFYGWIHDLSAPDPSNIFTLFGLISWAPPSFMHIGILPILMGISMFIQQKMNPQPMEAAQQKIFLFMPIFFTYLLAQFPAGLVIYWTWSNVLAMSQQMYIMKRHQK